MRTRRLPRSLGRKATQRKERLMQYRRTILATALVGATCAIAPAVAPASTVTADGGRIILVGEKAEQNVVRINAAEQLVLVEDAVPLRAGAGCVQLTRTSASCKAEQLTGVSVDLGAGDDVVVARDGV